jgi:hypothetical protein
MPLPSLPWPLPGNIAAGFDKVLAVAFYDFRFQKLRDAFVVPVSRFHIVKLHRLLEALRFNALVMIAANSAREIFLVRRKAFPPTPLISPLPASSLISERAQCLSMSENRSV